MRFNMTGIWGGETVYVIIEIIFYKYVFKQELIKTNDIEVYARCWILEIFIFLEYKYFRHLTFDANLFLRSFSPDDLNAPFNVIYEQLIEGKFYALTAEQL